MGCKQSVAFKETRKVAIERPSPLSFSSFSETPEKHSCRQVTVSQSEKDEQRQSLNRAVTLRGISTSEGLTASAESHEHESSAPPSLEARSKATTGHESLNDGENSTDSGERDSSTSNFSFIARPTPCRQPWERDGEGRWSQAGVLPREKLIEVHRTPHSQQSASQGSLSRHFRNPGRSADACPPGTALFGVPGSRQPGRQFFALTEQSQRACRAVALVSKAEQQRRASCGLTAGSYHPTGYVAKSDAVASQFRQLRAQKHTAAGPSDAFSESLPFSANQRWSERGRITQGHYATKWNGEDSGESRGEESRTQRVRLTEVYSAIADNRHYRRPVSQTGSQWSSASCPEAVQRSIAARRAAKNAFIAPPSTNMGPILQPCC